MAFYDENEKIVTIPIPWTDLELEKDPFVFLSEGRACFRPADLVALAEMMEEQKR